MNGLIEGYVGTEGSGKTTMMSYFLGRAAKTRIKIFAFPGYCLKDEKGDKIISETITPKEFIENFRIMRNVAVGIDEITNFGVDAYSFNGIFARIFGYAAAMRRKLSLSLLYTVQNFSYIPPRIRFFSHTLMFCKDMYFGSQYTDKPLPRGEQLLVRRMDLKGFYTGKEQTLSNAKIFHSRGMWRRFETESIVDIEWGLLKYQFQKNKVMLGQDTANPTNGANPFTAEEAGELIRQNLANVNQMCELSREESEEMVGQWVNQARDNNISQLSVKIVKDRLAALGLKLSDSQRGHFLKENGVKYDGNRGLYIFNDPDNQWN
jgi:hypothetical protein